MSLMKRTFIVGCPRSGTTLLQSLLAAHPDIISFPESHFYRHLLERRTRLRQLLGLASRSARPRFEEFLQEMGQSDHRAIIPNQAVFARQYNRAFIHLLDTLATQAQKTVWIEKTPGHLHYIPFIAAHVPGARFIHILRNGADVVASLYEVTHRHPQLWQGARTVDQCVKRWIDDAQVSLHYRHDSRHHIVYYEHLVSQTQSALEDLCHFIGVPFDPAMLDNYQAASQAVVLQAEQWKASVSTAIKNSNADKFYRLFDEQQQRYILEHVSVVDYSPLSVASQKNYERV
jgi:hypothetical protein